MSRKTYSLSAAAIVAIGTISFSSADMSGAVAQESDAEVVSVPEVAESSDTVFISQEVVQPLAAETLEDDDKASLIPQAAPTADSLRELVGQIDTSGTLSKELRCLAGAVYFEARGEPLAGQLAVAQVVMNRADDRRFPGSYCGVVYQRSQFSFVKGGRMPNIRTGTAAWKRAKAIAQIAHDAMWESEADDSLYFHAKYVRPSWSRNKTRRASINTHIFYR